MTQEQPNFSVIIPTRRRPERLAACLESLARQDYPREHFEVIVVDDGSKESPKNIIAAFCDRIAVSLITQAHAGPATARNTGAARAKGKYLAFTDDDCAPAADWLRVLADTFAGTPDCAVGGWTVNALVENSYSTASQMLIDYLYTYYNAAPHKASFFTSNNLALPTARFHALGGFDTTFPRAAAEDRDLCDRLQNQGNLMIYAPQAVVYHWHSLTIHSFWRQHFAYGCGAFQFHQARAKRCQEGIELERLGFYLNLLRYPFLQKPAAQAIRLAALMVVSQSANTAGFIWESTSSRGRLRRRIKQQFVEGIN
jgi:glycosyltransferase involved in cell wall biosynthesis